MTPQETTMPPAPHEMPASADPVQVVNLDWLSLSLVLTYDHYERAGGAARLHCPEGLHLTEMPTGTNLFRRRLLLHDDGGEKILTLLLEPHSKIIDERTLFVEVANKYLYADYSRLLDLFSTLHPYERMTLSRVDVACDFAPSPSQHAIIRQLADTSVYVSGKREGADWHTFRRGDGVSKVPHQLSWGSKYSDCKFKLYDKVKELTEIDAQGRRWITKPYIVDAWRAAGMDTSDVWRLEYSLTSASSHAWGTQPIDWALISAPDKLASWYYDMIRTKWRLRRNERHACGSNDTEVYLIDTGDGAAERTAKRLSGEHRTSAAFVPTLRACIKELERDEVRANKAMLMAWLQQTHYVIGTAGLEGYAARILGMPFEEYAAQLLD